MEGLHNLSSLKSLWLGKNKIEMISNLENMKALRQLDIQNNRLTDISGVSELYGLEEFYLAHNKIQSAEGLYGLPVADGNESALLSTIDLSSNPIATFLGIEKLLNLNEFWTSSTEIKSFEDIELLSPLKALSCIYLEHSPIARDFEYRKRITAIFPSIEQIDAVNVTRTATPPSATTSTST